MRGGQTADPVEDCGQPAGRVGLNVDDDEHGGREVRGQICDDCRERLNTAALAADDDDIVSGHEALTAKSVRDNGRV